MHRAVGGWRNTTGQGEGPGLCDGRDAIRQTGDQRIGDAAARRHGEPEMSFLKSGAPLPWRQKRSSLTPDATKTGKSNGIDPVGATP
jgi:hypothetical protein